LKGLLVTGWPARSPRDTLAAIPFTLGGPTVSDPLTRRQALWAAAAVGLAAGRAAANEAKPRGSRVSP